jgi:N-acetylmuramoyl-L-alanine amidase
MRWNSLRSKASQTSSAALLFNRIQTLGLTTFALTVGSSVLMALPAWAGQLQTWRFDPNRGQLEFTTNDAVQPSAQLITGPTRLIVDLPGTTFGRPQVVQPINAKFIKSLRVGQFDKTTTRIVLELEPGYIIDSGMVKFRGISANQWTVQIPEAKPVVGGFQPPVTPERQPISQLPGTARTQIQGVQITGDGLFVRTSGDPVSPQVRRSRDRRQIDIDFPGTSLSPSASPRDFLVGQRGIARAFLTQAQGIPPIARLTLNVDPSSGDWQATQSDAGGIVVIPASNGTSGPPPLPGAPSRIATINSVDLDNSDRQLLIVGDQELNYTTGWDRSTGSYRITLNNAQLARTVRGPQLNTNSPLLQVRLRQETPQTVSILITPAGGIQFGPVLQTSRQSIALPLLRSGRSPVLFPTNGTTIPVPPSPGPILRPRVPRDGRAVVIIDPGHGGPDPGAVGIGNIYEKEIVMDISRQVAAILNQNGVQAVLTRDGDYDLDLPPRVAMAEQYNATAFVSIHSNSISLSRPDVNGLETFYYDSGYDMARIVHNSVLQSTGMGDRRVRKANFYVLRKTSMPSILVETGFVTGAQDAANFNSPTFRRQMADGIAKGVLQYLRGG